MGRWVLDLEDGRLSAGHASANLTPKSAAVLACLIRHAGTVVSRDQILLEVWKEVHVSPDLVREYIFELRRALNDNPKKPKFIETVGRRGFRMIGDVSLRSDAQCVVSSPDTDDQEHPESLIRQRPEMPVVKFCRSKDGVSLAHAISGAGYPLLFAGSWMTHIEMDWDSPAYGDYLRHLSSRFRVIRYDQRGNGLSQWADVDIAFDRMVEDMEAVMDVYDFEKVAIWGMSQGASVSVAYAVRHPHRVSHLILNGGYARGRRQRGNDKDRQESEALVNLIRNNWGNDNPAIRQTLTTMVIHSDRDSVAPISEGKYLAANIPGATFQQLSSRNHMMFAQEEDFQTLISSIDNFIHDPN